MQSICTLLPDEFAQKIVDARAMAAEEPTIGAIFDPPFEHFTLQLAEEYDWDGLANALAEFAAKEPPFEAKMMGVFVFGGDSLGLAVTPYASQPLRDFHRRVWEAVTPYTQGKVVDFYTPDNWFPHVTIKRCGADHDAFARTMRRLVDQDFQWSFRVDNVSVQHDPGKNSRTHYLRHRFPLGGAQSEPRAVSRTNGALVNLVESQDTNGATSWVATIDLDAGGQIEHRWTAPELVRLMASLQCSDVHFAGGRCQVEGGRIVAVEPKTPYPLVR